jgi:hypothetical protein
MEGVKVMSCANLPGFKIGSNNGINQLTGEVTEAVDVKAIDIWSFSF